MRCNDDCLGHTPCVRFCAGTLDRTAMLLFAFDMFDLDQTGEIDGEEIQRSLMEVCAVEVSVVALS